MSGQKIPTALGTEKIGKLLMEYAIPAIIAMTASSLYNMIGSIFIGHGVGTLAILYFFGASESTIGYARDYIEVILMGNVVTHLYLGLNSILRSVGHPRQAMAATIATVAINAILVPIFIYGFDWGIRGAALAIVMAQALALLWLIKLFMNKNQLVHSRVGRRMDEHACCQPVGYNCFGCHVVARV